MSKQYHFVVCYDTDDNEFSLDIDTLYAKFTEGLVYDTGADGWAETTEECDEDYLAKEDILSGWLQHINTEIKEN